MTLNIPYSTIFRIASVLIGVWILYNIIDVLVIFFFGVIISSAITPTVDRMKKEGVPRIIAAALIYILITLSLLFVVYALVPPTIAQLDRLVTQFPLLLKTYVKPPLVPQSVALNIRQFITEAASGITPWLLGLVGGAGNVLLVFVISFYLTVEDRAIKEFLRLTLPEKKQEYVLDLIMRSQRTLSSWLKAQLLLMLIMGVLVFIGLSILGVPYKFLLAVLMGILEFIPVVGPIIGAVPAMMFALQISPAVMLFTGLLYLIAQQIESQFLAPLVMKKAFQINTILVLMAFFIGAKLGGIAGILISVPLLALTFEFLRDYQRA